MPPDEPLAGATAEAEAAAEVVADLEPETEVETLTELTGMGALGTVAKVVDDLAGADEAGAETLAAADVL